MRHCLVEWVVQKISVHEILQCRFVIFVSVLLILFGLPFLLTLSFFLEIFISNCDATSLTSASCSSVTSLLTDFDFSQSDDVLYRDIQTLFRVGGTILHFYHLI